MPYADFVHLCCHSAYSLSEGAIKADKLASLAAQNRMPAVAMTDSFNLFGAIEFSQSCVSRGVQPIIGCRVALTRTEKPNLAPDRVVLLAADPQGLVNLQRISSDGFLRSDPASPQLPLSHILENSAGLWLLTGGSAGPLSRLLAEGQEEEAKAWLEACARGFGDRLAVELHRHHTKLQHAVEPGIIALADRFGMPLVATNECYFAQPSMYEAHDALLCIADARVLSETDRRHATPENWFKPAADMRELFADLPDACDNTLFIAKNCAVMAQTRKPLLPVCPKVRQGSTEEETLNALAQEGLALRMEAMKADPETITRYEQRLAYELQVIGNMGFPGYFLIVADFIQWAKAQNIPVGPGRGSGAGSVAAWALTITDLDPLRFNLLFERFLNPERVSMPDFDIDFCQERRDEVISYVRREYGADRVAQIITFGKLQARAAVRDVGRVLGLPYGQVNRVAELIPNNPAKPVTLKEAIEAEVRLRDMQAQEESIKRLLEIAQQVEGLYRHASTHAAGVVIGDRDLVELVPMYRDPRENTLVTQYNMKYVEQAGLVKFDFLGLTTLTILQRAVNLLRARGVEVDLGLLPLDDAKTYAMLAKGDASGVFQFESAGMRDVLRQMRPDRFEDLIAGVALYRPGPMANIPSYCLRKHGEEWEPLHPMLLESLGETYGIMVYQEQVMQIAQTMGGYSLGAADLLRRAMGKKIRSEMDSHRKIFIDGALARGVDAEKAGEVFDLMAKFADYGFNKSHAAAYALVAYQTAWMKANYPEAFLAACMSLAMSNTDKISALRSEAARMGIAVLAPSVNHSHDDFTLEDVPNGGIAIRYALAAIKKLGSAAMKSLVVARGDREFSDITDFATRVGGRAVNKMHIENLARAGAFDEIEPVRARIFAGAEAITRRAQSEAENAGSGQITLFGGASENLRLPAIAEWPMMERLSFEAEAIGFHLTAHPLDAYSGLLRRQQVVPVAHLATKASAGGTRIKLAGCIGGVKERLTKKGSPMAWITLSDQTGSVEITCFSEVLGRIRNLLVSGTAIMANVDVKVEGEAIRITANEVQDLEQVAQEAGGALRIWLRGTAGITILSDVLKRERGGRGRVSVIAMLDDQEAEITLPGAYMATPRLRQAIKLVPGVERIDDL